MKRDYISNRLEGCLSPIAQKAGISIRSALVEDLWHRVAWDAHTSTNNFELDLLKAASCLLIELDRLLLGEWSNWLHFTNNVLPAATPQQIQSLCSEWWLSQKPNAGLDKKTKRLLRRHPPSLEACLELQHCNNYRIVQKMEHLLELFTSSHSLAAMPSDTQEQMLSFFCHLVVQERPWPMRIAACRALGAMFASGHKPERDVIAQLESIVLSKRLHPYLRAAAHAGIYKADPKVSIELAQIIFEQPEKSKDAFLFRRALLYVMVSCGHQGHKLLNKAAQNDASPAVKQKALELLIGSGDRLSEPFFRHVVDTESPEVRSAWILALIKARSDLAVCNALKLAGFDLCIADELEYKIACLRTLVDWLVCVKPDRVNQNIIQSFQSLKSLLEQHIKSTEIHIGLHSHWWSVIYLLSIRLEPDISLYFNWLQNKLNTISEGGRLRITNKQILQDPKKMEMVLSALASYDFGLYVKTKRNAWILQRGTRRKPTIWRLVFELLNPAFDKRQAHACTTGIRYYGNLWFPSLIMADLTRTRVPGENSYFAPFGSWVPQIPGPTQSLNLGLRSQVRMILPGISIELRSTTKPLRRITSQTLCKTKFKALDEQRMRKLQEGYPQAISEYLLSYQHQCRQSIRAQSEDQIWAKYFGAPPKTTLPMLLPITWVSSVGAQKAGLFQELWNPTTNTLYDLGLFLAVSGGLLFAHRIVKTHRIKKSREKIPLVIGGWGSRGKSGTERLKQALFHGLGYQTISKTTGTIATIISSIPGVDPVEIPLFRPFNKATIWEQANVLHHASEMDVQVFLWECMAVNPHFVGVLAGDWMHDTYSTITNTYPDHEDHQGPSGYDVAKSISMFTPHKAHLFTSEKQMTPVLRKMATERGSHFSRPPEAASYLIPKEYLDRFPYLEHPFNIALVQELARHLGIDEDLALIVMADNLLADIGGLKQFGPIDIHGRTTRFSNIMSANEREGFLSSMKHLGYNLWKHENRLQDGLVLIVNNREDRPARSRVFSELIVRDTASNGIVVVGSAVAEFTALLDQAWSSFLQERVQPSGPQADTQIRWLQSLFRPMRIDPAQSNHWEKVIGNWLGLNPNIVHTALYPVFEAIQKKTATHQGSWTIPAIESLYLEQKPALLSGIKALLSNRSAHTNQNDLLEPCGLELALAAILSGYHKKCLVTGKAQAVAGECIELAKVLFKKQIVSMDSPDLSPESLLEIGVSFGPPASNIHLVGCQNIKGIGLALVRAWQSITTIQDKLSQLHSRDKTTSEQALEWLCSHQLYTPTTARLVVQNFEASCSHDVSRLSSKETALLDRLRKNSDSSKPAEIRKPPKKSLLGRLVGKNLSAILDTFDSIIRRRQSDKIMKLLACGLIGHNEASKKLQEILNRQDLMILGYKKSKKSVNPSIK